MPNRTFRRTVLLAGQVLRNMGPGYVVARVAHEFLRRSGLLRRVFPRAVQWTSPLDLEVWRSDARPFFFPAGGPTQRVSLSRRELRVLGEDAARIRAGELCFFSGQWLQLGIDYDWLTNPISRYRYDTREHWTSINDFSPGQGDIKYVWEKSRFCFLHTLIRDQWLNGTDHGEFVFGQIKSWLAHNPLNCGPNYRCSQEISIRVLNWIWALYFHKDSSSLTEKAFAAILQSIYWQTRHVESNLWYARYTVRNNHLISEALCLYVVGTLFPAFDRARKWKRKGKAILEAECLHQILPDGTYTQYAMNYHRVVVQLYTWALTVAPLAGDAFSPKVHQRLRSTVDFLWQHQDETTGFLPNYGQNDGSLFFPLSVCHYRDYRPQLQALNAALNSSETLYGDGPWNEESLWFGTTPQAQPTTCAGRKSAASFPDGGFYVMRKAKDFAMVRCGNHRARPSHADNLHLDIWYEGINILRDAGSYSYNADRDTILAFMGTPAHNTVYLPNQHQMEKGPRFIWYHWTKAEAAELREGDEWIEFSGTIRAFAQEGRNITHTRTVRQHKSIERWEIEDRIEGWQGAILQSWNVAPEFGTIGFTIESSDSKGTVLDSRTEEGWYSDTYGCRESANRIVFEALKGGVITSVISRSQQATG